MSFKENLEVQAIIGEGAYGVVLKCHNLQTNETVAVKEFKINSDDPDVEEVKRTSTCARLRFCET